jgi:hypothetical protein
MHDLVCTGLEGTSPLGMLASLGLFRLLVMKEPDLRMSWIRDQGWHPVFHSSTPWDAEALAEELASRVRELGAVKAADIAARQRTAREAKAKLKPLQESIKQRSAQTLADAKAQGLKPSEAKAQARAASGELEAQLLAARMEHEASQSLLADALGQGIAHLGDIIGVQPEVFRAKALAALAGPLTEEARLILECLPAQASDGCLENDRLAPTPYSFGNGAGGQCLLKDFRTLAAGLTREEMSAALFSRTPLMKEATSLNWDPQDQRSYALQWRNPESEAKRVNVVANVLAFVGLALLPVMPGPRRIGAVGFGAGSSNWTWPLWEPSLPLDVIRGLLADAELQGTSPDTAQLSARGIAAHCRTKRFSLNKRYFFAPVETR